MKTFYYYMLKNGEIRFTENKPKNRVYIQEDFKRIDSNETNHALTGYTANNVLSLSIACFKCFCGYDRQVKIIDFIKAELNNIKNNC